MATTTIKLDSATRDRLNAEARREGTTAGRVLEQMLADRERARRFEALRVAVEAAGEDERKSYVEETAAWDRTSGDGLTGR